MKKIIIVLLYTLMTYSAHSSATELIPFLGFRSGGDITDESTGTNHSINSSNIKGLIITMPYVKGKTLELYYSHQSSELKSVNVSPAPTPLPATANTIPLTIDYLHLGGTTPLSKDSNLDTFVSGGLGFTYLSPDFTGLTSELRASFSIGIGMKWWLADNIALRFETRALATLFSNNSSIFCNGGCTLKINGNFFYQGEVFAGLVFRF